MKQLLSVEKNFNLNEPTIINKNLDYVTIKTCYVGKSVEDVQEVFTNMFGVEFETPMHTSYSKTAYFFPRLGIDFKVTKYHVEVEFHSTFFAVYSENSKIVILDFIQRIADQVQLVFTPIRLDAAVDVAGYTPQQFADSTRKKDAYFSFKAQERIREVKSRNIETIYYYGSKNRWILALYDKSAELKKNWSRMTYDKQEHYKHYRDQDVTRFELRFKTDYIKRHVLEAFYDKSVSSQDLVEMMFTNWSERRSIYKISSGETVDRYNNYKFEKLDIWEIVFVKGIKGKGLPDICYKMTTPIVTKEQLVSKLAKVFVQGELGMSIDPFEFNKALALAREKARVSEERMRASREQLLQLIAA